MNRSMKQMTSNIQLYTAQLDQTPVLIFIGKELVGSGVIDNITETSIKVKGEHYMQKVCTFKYAE